MTCIRFELLSHTLARTYLHTHTNKHTKIKTHTRKHTHTHKHTPNCMCVFERAAALKDVVSQRDFISLRDKCSLAALGRLSSLNVKRPALRTFESEKT